MTASSHPLETASINLEDYKANKVWMFGFVKQLCFAHCVNQSEAKSTIQILRSLNLTDIESIMLDEVALFYMHYSAKEEFFEGQN